MAIDKLKPDPCPRCGGELLCRGEHPDVCICAECGRKVSFCAAMASSFYTALREQDPAPPDNTPSVFIQWKGTNVCMDVHCACGAHGHVDGSFAYYYQCSVCGALYALHAHLCMTRLKGDAANYALDTPSCVKTDPEAE